MGLLGNEYISLYLYFEKQILQMIDFSKLINSTCAITTKFKSVTNVFKLSGCKIYNLTDIIFFVKLVELIN